MWEFGLSDTFAANVSEQSEDELVDACRRGNLRASERLYELHGGRMKSIAYRHASKP